MADPTRWRQHCEHWAARQATAVVCVSEAVREYARDKARIDPDKLVVIPNAIDVAIQRSVEPLDVTSIGVRESRRLILCVGRLHPQKGLEWLLETMPAVFERLPDHDLLIVGTGPEETRLQSQARALKIDSRVHFVGWRDDVPRLMAASSQLVLSSRWEGMPNVRVRGNGRRTARCRHQHAWCSRTARGKSQMSDCRIRQHQCAS